MTAKVQFNITFNLPEAPASSKRKADEQPEAQRPEKKARIDILPRDGFTITSEPQIKVSLNGETRVVSVKELRTMEIKKDPIPTPIEVKKEPIPLSVEVKKESAPSLDRVIDAKHILGEQRWNGKAVGYHFAPKGSPTYRNLQKVVVNPATGVFFAYVPYGKGELKHSSFFPSDIPDLDSLNNLLLTGQVVAKSFLRTLCKVERNPSEKSFYYMISLWQKRDGSVRETSCFPVFDFVQIGDEDDEEEKISFGNGLLVKSKEEIIGMANEMLAKLMVPGKPFELTCPVKFVQRDAHNIPESIIFDFGPALEKQIHGVCRGLLVEIKGTCLSYFGSAPVQKIIEAIE